MTNTLCEADIVRQQEVALQRKEHRLSEHKKRHSQQREAAYKDMLDAAPAVEQKPTLVAWILYDATTDKKYIKMDPADGSLAIFDSEESAMAAKKQNYGTDYERCEYYSAPQPAEQQAAQYPPCDFCNAIPDHHPWHGSGMFKGFDNPHIHACNDCRHLLPAPDVPKLVDAQVKSKVHIVQGVEVPDFRIEPKVGARYWYPTPASVLLCAQQVFRGNEFDIYRKENNLCYEDSVSGKQAAILHSKAWLGGEL